MMRSILTRSFQTTNNTFRRSMLNTSMTYNTPLGVRYASTFQSTSGSSSTLYKSAAALLIGTTGIYYYINEQNNIVFAADSGVWAKVREEIIELMDKDGEERGDGSGIGPTLVRLAWHSSGTYSITDNSGGSNGARMRFSDEANWGANAGLGVARMALKPIKTRHPEISYSDLWTFAGKVAIEEMGGPEIEWSPGRTDSVDHVGGPPDGRLPDADKGSKEATILHVREIFYRMGFNDQEIVALLGAHALGRCHSDRSGYEGPWTRAETTFSNEYFRLLLEENWSLKKTHEGHKWRGPEQYAPKDNDIMMLPGDMAMVWDDKFKSYVEAYAKDEALFFKDFAAAFAKLLENGVPRGGSSSSSSGGSFFDSIKAKLGF